MKFGVVVFPGSNCDEDCVHVLRDVVGQDVVTLWHQDTDLQGCDCLVLPGGFSYGDYLRTGAVARFSPIMDVLAAFARDGGLVIGICNGFRILLEAGLLPGAMMRNRGLKFMCRTVTVRVERTDTPWTSRCQSGQILRLPIAHNEGNYTADRKTLDALEAHNQVLLRYCDERGQLTDAANPNGSMHAIAGLMNEGGNVLGLMPHPERASEAVLGSEDGRLIFESLVGSLQMSQAS